LDGFEGAEAGEAVCFTHPAEPAWQAMRRCPLRGLLRVEPPRMSLRVRRGLSRLLPAMICGEESAALVFHHPRLDLEQTRGLRRGLARIEREERTHQAMLMWLRGHLPVPDDLETTRRRARRFFVRLDSRDLGTHLGRIVELDSAVCRLMHAAAHSPGLRSIPACQRVFLQIRADEARHVTMSRNLRRALGLSPEPHPDDRDFVRTSVRQLLEPLADAFDDIAVDPDRLFPALRPRVA
jgi:hypothetical protein